MTSVLGRELPPAGSHSPALTVAVLAEGGIADAALCALLQNAGHASFLVHTSDLSPDPLRPTSASIAVVVARSADHIEAARNDPLLADARFVGLGVASGDPDGIDLTDSPNAASELLAFLQHVADDRTRTPQVIRLTPREREIVVAYALGGTTREVAEIHHVAESTVREHYRRVVQRYEAVGRSVGNKSRLLVNLLADGWVRPQEIVAAV
ncbi:LuxR C-terminal-related transcriptional regulator [Gordonia sp. NB41Y]|uniref:helix-turn-helix transcriptional regulator n=1 Tax=Gordonia sp. NB41Y TaxID=875808 RepID=UPI0003499FFF|nr:LuxR C-terminal-related transcriptional regulator [Gordonia sp. NB41Y]WLP88611.1 LuxR C-terminal-related transcriptional regulator [Gordonia sp. NB41Y]